MAETTTSSDEVAPDPALGPGPASAPSLAEPTEPARVAAVERPAAPMTNAEFAEQVRGRYAGIVSRTGSFMIDIVVVAVVSAGGVLFLQAFLATIQNEPLADVSLPTWLPALITTSVNVIYFVSAWSVFGRTAGEALFGLKVVRKNGERVRVLRAVVRLIFTFPSLLLFGIGYLWILVDHRRRTWADLAAGTVVIYDWHIDRDAPHVVVPHA